MEKTKIDLDAPEIQAAIKAEVQAAVAAATKAITAEFAGQLQRPADPQSGIELMERLAMHIASLTDQGNDRPKRVAPEVLQHREEARKRMMALIERTNRDADTAQRDGRSFDPPVYELIHKIYIGDQITDPVWIDPATKRQRQTEIDWFGIPNEAMRPANDLARAIYAEYEGWLGNIHYETVAAHQVTARGLVITHQRGKPQEVAETSTPRVETPGGFRLRDRARQGEIVEKRVLGTIHQPALQTA